MKVCFQISGSTAAHVNEGFCGSRGSCKWELTSSTVTQWLSCIVGSVGVFILHILLPFLNLVPTLPTMQLRLYVTSLEAMDAVSYHLSKTIFLDFIILWFYILTNDELFQGEFYRRISWSVKQTLTNWWQQGKGAPDPLCRKNLNREREKHSHHLSCSYTRRHVTAQWLQA